jgi:ribosomal protein S18 acetylase RimI-like enzyme
MNGSKNFLIRKFRPSDRDTVRRLCCDTGFLGKPIDPVFEDRRLFADFLTGYYTDWEPESAFVIEVDGEVKGYLLGSRQPFRQQVYSIYQNVVLFLKTLRRYWGYNLASRRFVHWIVMNGWREVPAAPRRTAHFHINLLAEARNVPTTHALVNAYLAYLKEHGEKRVYGQMVTFESRRGAKMFERYGFKVLNRSEISKYRRFHPEPVYLCTVIKDLEKNSRLYTREKVAEEETAAVGGKG